MNEYVIYYICIGFGVFVGNLAETGTKEFTKSQLVFSFLLSLVLWPAIFYYLVKDSNPEEN